MHGFEDSPHGIDAAKRGGMKSVALTTSHPMKIFQPLQPDIIATNFEELRMESSWLSFNNSIMSFHKKIMLALALAHGWHGGKFHQPRIGKYPYLDRYPHYILRVYRQIISQWP